MKIETRNKLTGFSFIALWLIGFLLFWAFPLIFSFVMSLNHITIQTDRLLFEFVGFHQYHRALFMDAEIPNVSFLFIAQSLIIVPVIVVFALIMALMLNTKFPGRGVFRAIFFLPVVLTSGNLINELTNQEQGTLSFLQSTTVTNLVMTLPATWALAVTNVLNSFLMVLWYSGVQMLILIAGMQSINPSVYEAAKIDGANDWASLWLITLPGITPFIFISVVYTIVDQFTAPFNPILEVILHHFMEPATGYGYATAIAWLYFLLILIILGFVTLIFRKPLGLKK
ncbi:MAG: sugar ABC transporter permease [Defluviitaleaceae bacterium]|nr:sugar ABC transporter permease [Defluviitaleaceae bacterium]